MNRKKAYLDYHGFPGTSEGVKVGQMWNTNGIEDIDDGLPFSRLVVIVNPDAGRLQNRSGTEEFVRVAPVSCVMDYASEWDFIVRTGNDDLRRWFHGNHFIIEVWNAVPMLKKHLCKCFGRLDDNHLESFKKVIAADQGFVYDADQKARIDASEPMITRCLSELAEKGHVGLPRRESKPTDEIDSFVAVLRKSFFEEYEEFIKEECGMAAFLMAPVLNHIQTTA